MQLTTELHVSTLQGHHQAYKIMVLTKARAVLSHMHIPLYVHTTGWKTRNLYRNPYAARGKEVQARSQA